MTARREPTVVVAVAFLAVVFIGALFADVIAAVLGVSAAAVDPAHAFADASATHLLGNDALGRDLFVRLLVGARVSVVVAVAAAVVATVVGVVTGAVAAARGGIVDVVLMRVVDGLASLPSLPLVMMLAAVDVGRVPSTTAAVARVIVLLSVLSWMTTARLVRAQARHALTLDHVAAARALGASEWRVLVVHVLPLGLPAVIVQATLEAATNLVAEGALSFLGLGVPPPQPSWGNMLTGALDVVSSDAPTVVLPGLLLFFTAAALQVCGDVLRTRFIERRPSR
jgi:peptide/nickel transport system permease protein